MSKPNSMAININGNLVSEYACGVHDKDHTIILNGKPIRTFNCGHEEGDNRIILNGVPYRSYRRSEEDADAVFLNGKPYHGGEMGEVRQSRWMTSKRSGESSYSREILPEHSYSPQQGTINMNGTTIRKNTHRGAKTARVSSPEGKKRIMRWFALLYLGFVILSAILSALGFQS